MRRTVPVGDTTSVLGVAEERSYFAQTRGTGGDTPITLDEDDPVTRGGMTGCGREVEQMTGCARGEEREALRRGLGGSSAEARGRGVKWDTPDKS